MRVAIILRTNYQPRTEYKPCPYRTHHVDSACCDVIVEGGYQPKTGSTIALHSRLVPLNGEHRGKGASRESQSSRRIDARLISGLSGFSQELGGLGRKAFSTLTSHDKDASCRGAQAPTHLLRYRYNAGLFPGCGVMVDHATVVGNRSGETHYRHPCATYARSLP